MRDVYIRRADGVPIGWAAEEEGGWIGSVWEDGEWDGVCQCATLADCLHYIRAALKLQQSR